MTRIDTAPLSWVFAEVRSAASEAQEALAKFRAASNDASALKLAANRVHQLHGALQMLDIPGLSLLSEAIESLLTRFDGNPESATPAAMDAVDDGLTALTVYSEELLAGGAHQPLRLFPYLRDILAARGAERIHPADLLFPDLSVRIPVNPAAPKLDPATRADELRNARRRYEGALLRLLQGETSETIWAKMTEALRLVTSSQSAPQAHTFWTVAVAFAEAMRSGSVPLDINVKRLAARLNLQVKRLVDGAPQIAERLLKDALYFVAQAQGDAPELVTVRNAFSLEGSVPYGFEKSRFMRVDRDLLARARSKLAQVKGVWNHAAGSRDLEGIGNDRGRTEPLEQFVKETSELSNWFERLGLDDPKRLVDTLTNVVSMNAAEHRAPSDVMGIEVAAAILYLELLLSAIHSPDERREERVDALIARVTAAAQGQPVGPAEPWLDEIARREQDRTTMQTLAQELAAQLASIEKNLDSFFRNPADRGPIAGNDGPLAQVEGALGLLGLSAPQRAVAYVREQLRNFSSPEYQPSQDEFNALAENYGRLTLAVETFARDQELARDRYEFDEKAGLLREKVAVPTSISNDSQPLGMIDDPFASLTDFSLPPVESSLESVVAEHQKKTAELFEALSQAPEDQSIRADLTDSLAKMREGAAIIDSPELLSQSTRALAVLGTNGTGTAAMEDLAAAINDIVPSTVVVAPAPEPMPQDTASIDEELLGIFLEEASEVLENLEQHLPLAIAAPNDHELLTTIRRGFHTLKGSGRMVGLDSLGEAAWAIEQVMNYWLADGRTASPDLFALIGRATHELQGWVVEIAEHGGSRRNPADFQIAANSVREGLGFSWPGDKAGNAAPAETPASVVPAPASGIEMVPEPAPLPDALPEPPGAAELVTEPSQTVSSVPEILLPEVVEQIEVVDEAFDLSQMPSLEGATLSPELLQATFAPAEDVKQIGHVSISLALFNIYTAEADENVRRLTQDFEEWLHEPNRLVSDAALRMAHTLAGSAATVGASPIHELAHALEQVLLASKREHRELNPAQHATLINAARALGQMQMEFGAGIFPQAQTEVLSGLHQLHQELSDVPHAAAHLLEIFETTEAVIPDPVLEAELVNAEPSPDTSMTSADQTAAYGERVEAQTDLSAVENTDDVEAAPPITIDPSDTSMEVPTDAAIDSLAVQEIDSVDLIDLSPIATNFDEPTADALPTIANLAPIDGLVSGELPLPIVDTTSVPSLSDTEQVVTGSDSDASAIGTEPHDHEAAPLPLQVDDFALIDDLPILDLVASGDSVAIPATPDLPEHVAPEGIESAQAIGPAQSAAEVAGIEVNLASDLPEQFSDFDPFELDLAATNAVAESVPEPIVEFVHEPISEPMVESIAELIDEHPVQLEADSNMVDFKYFNETLSPSHAAAQVDVSSETIVQEPAAPPSEEIALALTESPFESTQVEAFIPVDSAEIVENVEVLPTESAAKDLALGLAPSPAVDLQIDPTATESVRVEVPTNLAEVVDQTPDRLTPFVELDQALTPIGQTDTHALIESIDPQFAQIESQEASVNEAVQPPETIGAQVTEEIQAPTTQSESFSQEIRPRSDVLPAFGLPAESTVKDEIEPELFELFSEEAQESLPMLGEALRLWQASPGNTNPASNLLRTLHTLKGSARMAGALRIGQNAHEMETRIEVAVATQAVDRALFDELNQRYDRLQLLLEVASGRAPESALITDAQRAEMQESFADETPSASLTQATSPSVSADQQREMEAKVELTAATEPANNVITFPTKPVAPEPLPAVAANIAAANLTKATLQQAQVGMVRVRSDILDRLVNQAGEVSIARTRMESEVSGIRVALSELTENVARLRSQLRELEIQAESQMESRMQQQRTHSEDFDPLEFDRFTRLQELTRLMAESVNDVATVQQNMNRNLVDADRDLITQARLTRDLTQDLMRVRMVPFDSVSDRLYRVVRQAGRDTGKRVNLDVRGGAVEVDRGVLERMIGPFEHLLRNAVAHGIERPQQRVASGKDESGSLLVDVRQEGNEMRITFVDDGAGLDFTRIRERAVQRGLITNEAVPSESDLTEMIFAPGFSTAEELTELSGRGVGMDVVRAESSSLGGRILVTSEVGKGTRFTIFLPLTLAVTQVVLVRVGTHTVALPSVLVAEVQQLKAQALAQAYNEAHLMSRGHSVSMHYLAELLAIEDAKPMAQKYSPIVVMAQGEERAAVHVDQVIGNREVVVKNIGPQLARVLGIAGATVLGSGEVVLIINPIPMAQRYGRQETSAPQTAMVGGAVAELVEATEPQVTQAPQAPRSQPTQGLQTLPVVMVVDDSLTVRRVTERLLTRAGYQVVLAKDGVDALRQLQDVSPDVMLVDIEMPRMDGFDLTRNVRGDARYQAVPIIMITSRTADKHRNFAFELGVNVFLGKPFQDEELLGHIKGFLAEKLGQAV